MTSYMQITKDNLLTFPVGAKVRFNYGAMHGSELGLVVDYEADRWGCRLVAETESGERKTITGFTTIGIGAYLESSH